MQEIDLNDARRVLAAEGWLGLGDWREAALELDAVAAGLQSHPDVLRLRFHIRAAAREWPDALGIAQTIAAMQPDEAFGWIHWAYSLHELKRTAEAYEVVSSIVGRFPKNATIPYNLACYSCQLGQPDEAMRWLKKAFKLDKDKDLRDSALDDPDLFPLRSRIKRLA